MIKETLKVENEDVLKIEFRLELLNIKFYVAKNPDKT